jgi:type IV pilus assembly protein PilF
MKQRLIALFVLTVIVLTGCSGNENQGIDVTKAAEANATLGLRYMQQGNYEVAMKKLQKAIKFDRKYAPAHHYLGELYRRLERYEDAEEHYRDALDYTKEEDYQLYNNYGIFLCSQGRYEEGEKQLLHVLQNPVYPQRAQVYENLGLCAEKIPNLERAEEYLRNALKMNPKLPSSLLAMARLNFTHGNYLSTRAYLQRYLAIARHNPQTLWLGIRTERLLGNSNAVDSYGLLLKSTFPDSKEAHLYLQSGGE